MMLYVSSFPPPTSSSFAFSSPHHTSTSTTLPSPTPNTKSPSHPPPCRKRWRWSASIRIGVEEITQVVQNKVLLAATLSTVAGQLSKPLTSAIRGHGFDPMAVVRSGGMPSTHSASVVAAATSLGLERGFSDSIFGMSVVFAAVIMYDAQGVRREVGEHSKAFNSLLVIQERVDLQQDKIESELEILSTINSEKATSLSLLEKTNHSTEEPLPSHVSGKASGKLKAMASRALVNNEEARCEAYSDFTRMNESVGHTKLQVIVGALLGLLASLTIEAIL